MRVQKGDERWGLLAAMADPVNNKRVRLIARDEEENKLVRNALEKTRRKGERLLREQLYPVKIDGARRTAVLTNEDVLIPGIVDVLGADNDVKLAKVAWLSRRDNHKAYGSMVVYCTTSKDASKLLDGQFMNVGGESAFTNRFERRTNDGPTRCYNCQETGHMAFRCGNQLRCGKCSEIGHNHESCTSSVPKCYACKGPHETYSRHCAPQMAPTILRDA